jgi:hypothetical protein
MAALGKAEAGLQLHMGFIVYPCGWGPLRAAASFELITGWCWGDGGRNWGVSWALLGLLRVTSCVFGRPGFCGFPEPHHGALEPALERFT